jgi:hypothetical protein
MINQLRYRLLQKFTEDHRLPFVLCLDIRACISGATQVFISQGCVGLIPRTKTVGDTSTDPELFVEDQDPATKMHNLFIRIYTQALTIKSLHTTGSFRNMLNSLFVQDSFANIHMPAI